MAKNVGYSWSVFGKRPARPLLGPDLSGDATERLLGRAVRFVALLLVAAIAALPALYLAQRFVRPSESPVDPDLHLILSQVRASPDDPELRVALANLYLDRGRPSDAVDQARQVLAVLPAHAGAAGALAVGLEEQGQLDEAIAVLTRVVDLNRDNPLARSSPQLAGAYQSLGRLLLRQGKTDQAIDALRQSLEIDRANADSLYLLGKALAASGQLNEAAEALRQAVLFVPDYPEVYAELVRVYDRQGDRTRARYAWGMVRYSTGEYEQAVDTLRQAVQSDPGAAEPHLGLGMAYERLDRRQEALDEYRRALALDARLVAARQGIGRLGGQP